jgi:aminoglycoside phosphotransferase (APT) family kinase protein
LQDRVVKESLGDSLLTAVKDLVRVNTNLLPDKMEANLTHADYDPANILVKQISGRWKITSILDWEFSFAGTYLMDMGMMLRYSHKLPVCYENRFLEGIQSNGFRLPLNWKKQAKLMDLLCLLQLAHYNAASERPKLNRDVVSLITNTVKNWESF